MQAEMDHTSYPRIYVQTTLALIKPDSFHKAEEIEDVILKSGFVILQKLHEILLRQQRNRNHYIVCPPESANNVQLSKYDSFKKRKLQLSPEQCSDFYADQYGKPFFPSLTAFMSSGPIVAMTLARDNAVAHWKSIAGPVNSTKARETHPGCLRAKYGTSDLKNALHGSESLHAAEREIKFMFPNSIIEPLPSRESVEEYLSRHVNPTLLRGLTELCKHKPHNPCIWLADWLIKNDPNKPQICDGVIVEEAE